MKISWASMLLKLLVVLLLVDPLFPVFGDEPLPPSDSQAAEDRGPSLDGELGIAGGGMHLVRPSGGCSGPRAINGNFGGIQGRIRAQTPASKGQWRNRAEAMLRGEVRYVEPSDDSGSKIIATGNAEIGWNSRFLELRAGLLLGTLGSNEAFGIVPAFSLRFGSPLNYLRLSVLEGPGCLSAYCLFGIEGAVNWMPEFMLRAGASFGIISSRVYLQVPSSLGGKGPWLTPGLEIHFPASETSGSTALVATLAFGFPEL